MRPRGPLDELDLVAVGVFDEGDDGGAVLHRTRRPGKGDPFRLQALAGGVYVRNADGHVPETATQVVGLVLVPVVGQLDHCVIGLGAIADEGEGELAAGEILAAQLRHAEKPRVEIQGLVQVAHPDHGVEDAESFAIARRGGGFRGGGGHGFPPFPWAFAGSCVDPPKRIPPN